MLFNVIRTMAGSDMPPLTSETDQPGRESKKIVVFCKAVSCNYW